MSSWIPGDRGVISKGPQGTVGKKRRGGQRNTKKASVDKGRKKERGEGGRKEGKQQWKAQDAEMF